MTQGELSTKCDLQLNLIMGIGNGKEDPSSEDLAKIAEVLGVEMFDLVRGKQQEQLSATIRKEIIEMIDAMGNKNNLQLILEILQAMR